MTREVKQKDVGNGGGNNIALLWWNSETQSNWWDGYIRTSFLLNDKPHIEKIKTYVNRILATQDPDGYLGIYAPDLRYNFDKNNGENGELWAKTTLFRSLLAYYGFTNDKAVLKAVERGVQNVMDNYKINVAEPFKLGNPEDGITHGLNFTDVLDQLYQLTHDVRYWDYALFLYRDYSVNMERNGDIRYQNIMDSHYRLYGHAAHTFEHFRPLLVASYASGNPQLQEALSVYMERLKEVTTVSGGPVGDEWILGRKADPTYTGYEYCTMLEKMDSYTQFVQKSGDIQYADEIEKMLFNATMGAHHPEKSLIPYLKTDNSYTMNGTLNGMDNPHQTRYKYSPAHQDIAVCCNPNAGRILPYYIHAMWLKDKDGLVAALYGGCELNTQFGKQPVSIREITDYPYSNRITFEVEVKKPVTFALKIRKPAWNKGFTLDADYKEEGDYLVIHKKWSGKESLTVEWKAEPEKHTFNGETYFTYGALVLAVPVETVEIPKRVYVAGFQDFQYTPLNLTVYQYADNAMPVKNGEQYTINLYNPIRQKMEQKKLLPMSSTILRQVTFKNK
jgi:DUF1680 family protein